MSIKDDAQRIHANLLEKTDPEAVERINHFAFDEVQAMLICLIELRCCRCWHICWGCKA